jgi:hypothetical protein
MQEDSKPGLIVDLTEIFSHKEKKEKELQYYQAELEKLILRMTMVQQEIKLTETILIMIKQESVVDLKKMMAEKYDPNNPFQ